eukprot:2476270-Prymnesium_polylepis.1
MDCYVTVQQSGTAAHPVYSVATDCAGGDSDCAAPFDCHPFPPPCKGEDAFSSFITLHWVDGLLRNGSIIWEAAHRCPHPAKGRDKGHTI